MPGIAQPDLAGLLYEALETDLGLIVRSNNRKLLMQKLYAIKREDEALASLSLSLDRIASDQLLILKRPSPDVPT